MKTTPAPGAPARASLRRSRGQHATRGPVADLMCALAMRSPRDAVLDPSCGEGALLERARARLKWLGGDGRALLGVEIDSGLAALARGCLPGASIVTGDFLAGAGTPGEPATARREGTAVGPVDVVVGNPPYVRQELLDSSLKRRLAAQGLPEASGRCDLHTYFWPEAMRRLKPGGRLTFLTSGAWLDAAYGETLRRWLLERFTLVALVESEVESWFDQARVRTVIAVVDKVAPASGARVAVTRLDRRLDEIASTPDAFDRLARSLERGDLGRTIAQHDFSGRRWGCLIRQPALAADMIARAGDALVPLADVATVRWGIKTGDDQAFFCPADKPLAVEPRYLAPVAFNLMELDRMTVTREQLKRRLLLVDLRDGPIAGTKLSDHVRRIERERATHLRPTCAARERHGGHPRRWFELRPGPPGAILWSIMHQYRHLAPLNPEGFPANDNLLLVDPVPGVDARLLAALLNSHVQALIKLGHGRRRNEGMLKMQASDVKEMLVPDMRRLAAAASRRIVAAFDAMAHRPIGKVADECLRPDRRQLDREVLRGLGFAAAGIEPLLDRLYETLTRGHRDERRWEVDAVARRRRVRPEAPRSAIAPAV